jgi:hypothetical protein
MGTRVRAAALAHPPCAGRNASAVRPLIATAAATTAISRRGCENEESDMISELQIHVIARQMFERHGFEAIAKAAQNAIACESRGEADEASEWRHLEDAMKMMRGPHQS